MTTAVVIGATGLTGSALVRRLLRDARWGLVIALVRRATGVADPKLRETIVDFETPDAWAGLVHGDVAFSTLGTTRRDAGSLAAQRRVDVDYQLAFATAAARNGVPTFVLLSSIGASATSRIAYSRMKGELDDAVSALPFPRVRVLRPGLLDGPRLRPRPAEHASLVVARLLARVGIARDYRPIPVDVLARAMLAAASDGPAPRRIYTGDEIFTLAGDGERCAPRDERSP
jgi:uncharacterized protein YbjT (DUF2867 family)